MGLVSGCSWVNYKLLKELVSYLPKTRPNAVVGSGSQVKGVKLGA